MLDTKIKVCGLKRPEDIAYVNEAKPDYCGFIIDVPKSKRSIDTDMLRSLVDSLDEAVIPVGVFVDDEIDKITELVSDGVITTVQLHGSEDEAYINKLRSQIEASCAEEGSYCIIKAFSIKSSGDVERALNSSADYILLDQGSGGTGKTFDWSCVYQMKDSIDRPFFLAGGIGADNIEEAIGSLNPLAVDLSSSLETDGVKDRNKIIEVVNKVRRLNSQVK